MISAGLVRMRIFPVADDGELVRGRAARAVVAQRRTCGVARYLRGRAAPIWPRYASREPSLPRRRLRRERLGWHDDAATRRPRGEAVLSNS